MIDECGANIFKSFWEQSVYRLGGSHGGSDETVGSWNKICGCFEKIVKTLTL